LTHPAQLAECDAADVHAMFDRIARRHDLVNTVISSR
jgi:ubiquinone/menaquinone biosynthesis C-methylase UbiE